MLNIDNYRRILESTSFLVLQSDLNHPLEECFRQGLLRKGVREPDLLPAQAKRAFHLLMKDLKLLKRGDLSAVERDLIPLLSLQIKVIHNKLAAQPAVVDLQERAAQEKVKRLFAKVFIKLDRFLTEDKMKPSAGLNALAKLTPQDYRESLIKKNLLFCRFTQHGLVVYSLFPALCKTIDDRDFQFLFSDLSDLECQRVTLLHFQSPLELVTEKTFFWLCNRFPNLDPQTFSCLKKIMPLNFTIIAEEGSFEVNVELLAYYSPVFKALLEHSWGESLSNRYEAREVSLKTVENFWACCQGLQKVSSLILGEQIDFLAFANFLDSDFFKKKAMLSLASAISSLNLDIEEYFQHALLALDRARHFQFEELYHAIETAFAQHLQSQLQVLVPLGRFPPTLIEQLRLLNDYSLGSLCLEDLPGLIDAQLVQILECLDHLEQITIINCPMLTPEAFSILSKYSDLKKLVIQDCQAADDALLQALAPCKSLSILKLSDGSLITDEGVIALRDASFVSLELFNAPQLTDRSLEVISRFRRLTNFSLSGCERVTDQGLGQMTSLPLRFLKLEKIRRLTGSFLAEKALPLLEQLVISSNYFNDHAFYVLSLAAPNLQMLQVEDMALITADMFLNHLSRFIHLQWLEIKDCGALTSSGFDQLNLPHLQRLALNSCRQIDETIFSQLSSLPSLHTLILKNIDSLIDVDLPPTRLRIRTLSIQETKVRNLDVLLEKMPYLETLELFACELGDRQLLKMKNTEHLQVLSLKNNRLSVHALELIFRQIRLYPHLKRIEIAGNPLITLNQVNYYSAQFPHVNLSLL
ncbi:MAG: F-box/LRR-repeat protein 3 [Chlamydiales bacterium]|nr:F-box/LRR-repeat protein 3 [Chlamydiales bacterium]